MKKILLLCIGLLISAASVFGQKTLKITEKDKSKDICRCRGANEACVEIQSNVPLTFESNMDKELCFCDMKHENGFYFYLLKFSQSNRKLTIKSVGYQYYIYDLDFNFKTFVGLYVDGGENFTSGPKHNSISICGLEVMRADLPRKYNWPDALQACPKGWRLPTENELRCLCEQQSRIGNFNSREYWSSTDSPEDLGHRAISHTFDDCEKELSRDTNRAYSCRCVKDVEQ